MGGMVHKVPDCYLISLVTFPQFFFVTVEHIVDEADKVTTTVGCFCRQISRQMDKGSFWWASQRTFTSLRVFPF